MKWELLILLAAVTLPAAMVPRLRRAVNMEQDDFTTASPSSNISKICMPQTPCAWSIYKKPAKIIDTTIENLYCTCSDDMVCLGVQDDSDSSAYIHFCRPPNYNEENAES